MGWVMTILIGAATGWLGFLILRAHARFGMLVNTVAGAAGPLAGAYCAATMSSGLPSAPLLWMIAVGSAILSTSYLHWVATPVAATRLPRRR